MDIKKLEEMDWKYNLRNNFAWSPLRKLMKELGAQFVARDTVDELMDYLTLLITDITKRLLAVSDSITPQHVDSLLFPAQHSNCQNCGNEIQNIYKGGKCKKCGKVICNNIGCLGYNAIIELCRDCRKIEKVSFECVYCKSEVIIGIDDWLKNSKDVYIHLKCVIVSLTDIDWFFEAIDERILVNNFDAIKEYYDELDRISREDLDHWALVKIGLREYGLDFLQFIMKKLRQKNLLDEEIEKILINFSEFEDI